MENKSLKLSPHFTLGELCKTSVNSLDGNNPSREDIENLKRLCLWLEELRKRYNELYVLPAEEPIIISSGYRSPEVNKCVGGVYSSNHLTGCAVDIRCVGVEQAIRYAAILLDIADEWERDFDELLRKLVEIRYERNRRRTMFLQA